MSFGVQMTKPAYFTTVLCTLTFIGQTALAQITAQDTWDSLVGYTATFGAELSGTLTQTDTGLDITDVLVRLPSRTDAAATLAFGDLSMVERSDGTVELNYSETQDIRFAEAGKADTEYVTFRMNRSGMEMHASGVPGNVTFETQADQFDFSLIETAPSSTGTDLADAEFSLSILGLRAQTKVNVSGLTEITQSASHDRIDFSLDISPAAGDRQTMTGTATGATTGYHILSPSDEIVWTDLPGSFEAGLGFGFFFDFKNYTLVAIIDEPDDTPVLAEMDLQDLESRYGFDRNGVVYNTSSSNVEMSFQFPEDDLPKTDLRLDKLVVEILLPTLARDTSQLSKIKVLAENLRFPDNAWDLLDPENILPRDPITLSADMEYGITMNHGLFDGIIAGASNDPAMTIDSFEAQKFFVSGLGVDFDGTGKLALDFEGMTPFSGMPNIDGNMQFTLTGAHGLLDNLLALDLLSVEETFAARAALGMATKPDGGPDQLKSEFVFDGEANSITANGLRIR